MAKKGTIMRSIVYVNEIPDPQAKINISINHKSIINYDSLLIADSSDLQAIELALQLRERHGGDVIALSFGSSVKQKALRTCLELGVDRVFQLQESSFQGHNAYRLSLIIANAVRSLSANIVLTGYSSSLEGYGGNLGALVASILNIPFVSRVDHLDIAEDLSILNATRSPYLNQQEYIRCKLPAVLTVVDSSLPVRYSSLSAKIASTKEIIEILDSSSLGISEVSYQECNELVKTVGFYSANNRKKATSFFTPDNKMSARERLLAVVAGGLVEKQGEWIEDNSQVLAQKILSFLIETGVIQDK